MSKGEETREMILRQAAQLFNRRGFYGALLTDIMQATQLEKGGIYNHFNSKEELALEAFDYAVNVVHESIVGAVRSQKNTVDALLSMIAVFQGDAEGHPLASWCPVMNTAIEADDSHPALRMRAQEAMDDWYDCMQQLIQLGIKRGEINPDVDVQILSTGLISTLEGAILQSKLYDDPKYIQSAVTYLTDYLERVVRLEQVLV
jgi:AcrR family transcriptional regulator